MINDLKVIVETINSGEFLSYKVKITGTCYGEPYTEDLEHFKVRVSAISFATGVEQGLRLAYQQMRIQLQDSERRL